MASRDDQEQEPQRTATRATAQPEPEPEPAPPEPAARHGEPAPDSDELPQPGGLLGLLLWPLRAAISLALQVFAAFVRGVLEALLPGRRRAEPPPDDEG